MLDIKLVYLGSSVSTKDVQRELYSALASLASPALERMRLLLQFPLYMPLSGQVIDTTTLADRAQYADLHAVLARPIFSSLHRVTVVLYTAGEKESKSPNNPALEFLVSLRALFAPWCVRGIVNFVCAARPLSQPLDVVVDKGEGLRSIKWSGSERGWEQLLADLGL